MRQRLTNCYRIMAPAANRGVLLVLSLFLGMLLTVLAAALLHMPAQPLILAAMQGDWLKGIALAVPTVVAGLLIWKGLCLLTDGTFESAETGPEGLLVQGLFGRRHRRWDEIDHFGVSIIPVATGIVIVIARPAAKSRRRPMRFFMSGYFRIGWFNDIGDQQRETADWLQEIKAAYTIGTRGGPLPAPPEHFAGRVIELPAGSVATKISAMQAVG